ncbi:hypothetical protein LR48_Vigan11g064200 [Vigna angularis]|uniref:Uncharacterized protein n=1 Tax=Phaseolus angularis TaxID=3914 RepID=A0A0L9VS87_PHAAN|nr:hypothetical protein LR48_Vigan11g064200 [Vigna angularis]
MQFKESRLTPEWQVKRIAAQQRQKLNDTPHVLLRGGYALLEKKIRKRRAEELGLESLNLAPPPARNELWKAARTKSNGQFTSQAEAFGSYRRAEAFGSYRRAEAFGNYLTWVVTEGQKPSCMQGTIRTRSTKVSEPLLAGLDNSRRKRRNKTSR